MHHSASIARQPLYGHDLYRWIMRYALDAAWAENQHPRDGSGRFTDGLADWRGVRNAVLGKLKSQYPKPMTVRASNGDSIIVSYSGLRHALNKGVPTPQKSLLSLYMQELVERAIKTKVTPDRYGRKDPASVTHYTTDVSIDGAMFDVDIVIRNHNDGNRYYDHFSIEKKPASASTRVVQEENTPPRSYSGLRISMRQLREVVK